MITGYNTDVRYGEVVLHVQTEDKGRSNPFIESLVYFRGQVVVAKRAGYADILRDGKGADEITTLMESQHRLMIKAIKSGKLDDKILPLLPSGGTGPVEPSTASLELGSESGRTLDQVILEYLNSEAEQEQLVLLLENDVEMRPGQSSRLVLRARSSKSGQPIQEVRVQVRMISTVGGPQILATGETDAEGLLDVTVEVPVADRGTAALIVTASADIGQAELKHLL